MYGFVRGEVVDVATRQIVGHEFAQIEGAQLPGPCGCGSGRSIYRLVASIRPGP